MNRTQRIENASQTLDITKRGVYIANGHEVNISDAISRSVRDTLLYTPEALSEIARQADQIIVTNRKTAITVVNQTTMEALREMTTSGKSEMTTAGKTDVALVGKTEMTTAGKTDVTLVGKAEMKPVENAEMTTAEKIGCLNFASAKNPGGGFLSGALAQEECLAAASSLYPSLSQPKCLEMYEYNRSRKTCLYSDYMIYSPNVVFFKDDTGLLLETPYQADVLTSPAVNIAAMSQTNPSDLPYVEQTMMSRIDKMFAVFALHNVETLVLGAWGCGVFQNNPHDIARYFATFLTGNGKYAGYFRKITFAVYDRSINQENFNAFREVFGAHC